jgi:hypothetical protein
VLLWPDHGIASFLHTARLDPYRLNQITFKTPDEVPDLRNPTRINLSTSMHWIVVVLLSLILTTANSAPTNAPTATLSERQSSRDDLVTGIDWRDENGESARTNAGDWWSDNEVGDVPLRREIRDLKDNHPDQWNLYILALSAMQMVEQEDDSSYYAVAGECRRSPAI